MVAQPAVLIGDGIRDITKFQHPSTLDLYEGEREHGRVVVSPSMHQLEEVMRRVARTTVPVLILGESGTGKEVAARAIHQYSPRANRRFLKVNCAALPRELMESELFGYEAGAFTGATRPKPGQFELCDGGTLMLDEVAEMPTELQAKLLHVIQDGQFCRLGGRSMVRVDVRLLAATNVDVQQAMATKQFREDLYYRLNTFTIHIPPLRERKEEIPALIEHFIRVFSAEYGCAPLPVTPGLLEGCLRHSWPGNLRELENVVKRYLILGDDSEVLQELTGHESTPEISSPTLSQAATEGLRALTRQVKQQVESSVIAEALQATNYNCGSAARLLKISCKSLRNKVRDYALAHASALPSTLTQ